MLKYAPLIASSTFSLLLKTNPHLAYQFGQEALVHISYTDPPYQSIIDYIELYSNKLNLPVEVYKLGAEAYQIKINKYSKFGNLNIPKNYFNMANMYWLAKDDSKAIECVQKAIKTLKSEKIISNTDLSLFENRLKQYKKYE